MAIIKDIVHGECRIHICDDYIRNDSEEIKKILDNVGRIAYAIQIEKIKKERETGKSA